MLQKSSHKIIAICGAHFVGKTKASEYMTYHFPHDTFRGSRSQLISQAPATPYQLKNLIKEIMEVQGEDRVLIINPHMEDWVTLHRLYESQMFSIFLSATIETLVDRMKSKGFTEKSTPWLRKDTGLQHTLYAEHKGKFAYYLKTDQFVATEVGKKMSDVIKEKRIIVPQQELQM